MATPNEFHSISTARIRVSSASHIYFSHLLRTTATVKIIKKGNDFMRADKE